MKKLISILCLSTLITGFTSYISISKDLHLKCGSHEILLEDGVFSTKVSVANKTTNYRLKVTKSVMVNKKQIIVHGKETGQFYSDPHCSIRTTCSYDLIYSRTGNKESYEKRLNLNNCYHNTTCEKVSSDQAHMSEIDRAMANALNPRIKEFVPCCSKYKEKGDIEIVRECFRQK